VEDVSNGWRAAFSLLAQRLRPIWYEQDVASQEDPTNTKTGAFSTSALDQDDLRTFPPFSRKELFFSSVSGGGIVHPAPLFFPPKDSNSSVNPQTPESPTLGDTPVSDPDPPPCLNFSHRLRPHSSPCSSHGTHKLVLDYLEDSVFVLIA